MKTAIYTLKTFLRYFHVILNRVAYILNYLKSNLILIKLCLLEKSLICLIYKKSEIK